MLNKLIYSWTSFLSGCFVTLSADGKISDIAPCRCGSCFSDNTHLSMMLKFLMDVLNSHPYRISNKTWKWNLRLHPLMSIYFHLYSTLLPQICTGSNFIKSTLCNVIFAHMVWNKTCLYAAWQRNHTWWLGRYF